MDKHFILKYKIDEKEYRFNSLTDKDDNMDADIVFNDALTEIKITPHNIIDNVSLEIIAPCEIAENQNVYCNGFQSWSYSREYGVNEKYDAMPIILRPLLKKMGVLNIGDESFAPQPRDKGVFKSSGHFYIRNVKSDNIRLIGSTDESVGYTTYVIDCNKSAYTAVKDFEGLVIDKETILYKEADISAEYDKAWDDYFDKFGIIAPNAPNLVGYSSWYNNYRNISEKTILRDLEAIAALGKDNINIFQIDDGYQPAIGDIIDIDRVKFPNGLKSIAEKIHAHGLKAGLWMCPFGVTQKSKTYKNHNDWLIKNAKNKPIKAGVAWGGFYALDIYNEEAREYIKNGINTVIKDWGFDLLKLDFLYSAAIAPRNGKTRAMIMRDAVEFLRECVPDTPIIGCGAPIAASYNAFEYMRIGADCAFSWGSAIDRVSPEMLSTRKTIQNMLYRRYYDKRAFLNDPDVFYLRESNIKMSPIKKYLHADLCKSCGSVTLTSDDVSEYDENQKEKFAEMISQNRKNIKTVEHAGRYTRVNYADDSFIIFDGINGNIINSVKL